jgi:hypothetical protein
MLGGHQTSREGIGLAAGTAVAQRPWQSLPGADCRAWGKVLCRSEKGVAARTAGAGRLPYDPL